MCRGVGFVSASPVGAGPGRARLSKLPGLRFGLGCETGPAHPHSPACRYRCLVFGFIAAFGDYCVELGSQPLPPPYWQRMPPPYWQPLPPPPSQPLRGGITQKWLRFKELNEVASKTIAPLLAYWKCLIYERAEERANSIIAVPGFAHSFYEIWEHRKTVPADCVQFRPKSILLLICPRHFQFLRAVPRMLGRPILMVDGFVIYAGPCLSTHDFKKAHRHNLAFCFTPTSH